MRRADLAAVLVGVATIGYTVFALLQPAVDRDSTPAGQEVPSASATTSPTVTDGPADGADEETLPNDDDPAIVSLPPAPLPGASAPDLPGRDSGASPGNGPAPAVDRTSAGPARRITTAHPAGPAPGHAAAPPASSSAPAVAAPSSQQPGPPPPARDAALRTRQQPPDRPESQAQNQPPNQPRQRSAIPSSQPGSQPGSQVNRPRATVVRRSSPTSAPAKAPAATSTAARVAPPATSGPAVSTGQPAPRQRGNPVACSENSLRSERVTFVNNSRVPLRLEWSDFSCQRRFYGIVPPGGSLPITSYVTHSWVFIDPATGFTVGTHVIRAGDGYIRMS